MISSRYKYNYNRNLLISFVLSVLIITLSFVFIPPYEKSYREILTTPDLYIPVEYVPSTKIITQQFSKSNDEKINEPSLQNEILLTEKLTEVIYDTEVGTSKSTGVSNAENDVAEDNSGSIKAVNYFSARQVLEVMPSKIKKFTGSIKLSVLVNKDGRVKDHKILQSTIECEDCVKLVIDALYSSRWQPLLVEGKRHEFWTEKIYNFN